MENNECDHGPSDDSYVCTYLCKHEDVELKNGKLFLKGTQCEITHSTQRDNSDDAYKFCRDCTDSISHNFDRADISVCLYDCDHSNEDEIANHQLLISIIDMYKTNNSSKFCENLQLSWSIDEYFSSINLSTSTTIEESLNNLISIAKVYHSVIFSEEFEKVHLQFRNAHQKSVSLEKLIPSMKIYEQIVKDKFKEEFKRYKEREYEDSDSEDNYPIGGDLSEEDYYPVEEELTEEDFS